MVMIPSPSSNCLLTPTPSCVRSADVYTLRRVSNGWVLNGNDPDNRLPLFVGRVWVAKTPTEAAKIIEAEEKKGARKP